MVGVDAAGDLNCQPIVDPCPAVTGKQICTGYTPDITRTFDIPANILNSTFTSPVAGDSYRESYKCVNRSWQLNFSSGTCLCTPSSTPSTKDCNTTSSPSWPPAGAGNGGYSGSYVDTQNVSCGPKTTTWAYNTSNACVCNAATPPLITPQYVPTGCQGVINSVKTWTCDAPGPYDTTGTLAAGHWTNTTVNNATCQMGYFYTYADYSCPAGYTGYYTKKVEVTGCSGSSATTPPCDWNSPQWTTTTLSNNCTCVNGSSQTQVRNDCPAGTTGTTTWRQTLTCPSTWSAWSRTSYDCISTSFTWAAGAYFAIGASPLPNKVGNACATQGARAQCSDASNKYYNDCVCQ
jgi:hypothetical protein